MLSLKYFNTNEGNKKQKPDKKKMSNFFDSPQDANTESKVLKESVIILYYTEIILT